MPNKKSAAKRVRQNEQRRERNRAIKHAMSTTLSRAQKAIESGDLEAASTLVQKAQSVAGKTSAKGAVHPNKTARKISRLTQKFNAAKNEATAQE
ncbi:30S ribosomal protein S20 [Candidatus Sumerlaeota bacterium]|nr:30S ribosomal protein S20 [Candidatus Sumerlaeota bacterium]